MLARKRTDNYPITATLKTNGVAANLTGYTVTLNVVDKATRDVIVANQAVTVTDAANGRVSYTPIAADVAAAGSFDVEFKVVGGGNTYHFPSQDYEPLQIQQNLGSGGTPPVNPYAGSITLSMLEAQTPGSVLLYDASGNATAYAPVAAGRVLTDSGPGLPPTYQASGSQVLIDPATLTNASLYTSPTWAAGTYRRIRGVLKLSSWTHAQIRFAGIGAATGRTAGTRIAGTAFSDTTAMWLNFAISSPEIGIIRFELDIAKDTAPRGGSSRTSAVDVATGLVTDMGNLNFQTTDLTTDITGILIDFLTTNATGTLRLYGETT